MVGKKLLFSLTKKDFKVEYFKSSGPGGQKKNKTESSVRIKHIESGATAEGKESRHRHINRRNAFNRLVGTEKFKNWHKIEVAKKLGQYRDIEKEADKWVEQQMKPENLRIEYT